MPNMHVKAHWIKNTPIPDYESEVEGNWTWEQMRATPRYQDWVSFCSLVWDRKTDLVYAGIASFENDIFWTFDRSGGTFTSLNYRSFGDKYDAKFHRSLELDEDGTFYAATALLHDPNHMMDTQGGKLLKYEPASGKYTLLDIPVPHHYIQSITLDPARRVIFGATFPAEILFRYDMKTGQSRQIAYIGAGYAMGQAEKMAVDHTGRLWGTWVQIRAWEAGSRPKSRFLFCYDPAKDDMTWFLHGIPKLFPGDQGTVDTMLSAEDEDMIYIGSSQGALCRLDPRTADVELLGKPCNGRRLTGLRLGPDGRLYGVGGDGERVRVFSFDRKSKKITHYGIVYDHEYGEGADHCHDMCLTDDYTVFAGENDNPRRSGFLWECQLSR
jgi:hypothetical protein